MRQFALSMLSNAWVAAYFEDVELGVRINQAAAQYEANLIEAQKRRLFEGRGGSVSSGCPSCGLL